MEKTDGHRLRNIYLAVVGMSCITWIIVLFYQGYNSVQYNVFFDRCGDLFADFTNVCGYSSQRDVYRNTVNSLGQKGYPPLPYVLTYFFSKLASWGEKSYSTVYIQNRFLIIFVLFLSLSMILFWCLVYENIEGRRLTRYLCALTITYSGCMISLIERGNLLIQTLIFIMIFVFYYDNESKIVREFAYFSLALAVAFKASPAIFAFLLLYKKEWKAFLRVVLYSCILFFAPFLFFEGGLENVQLMLRNMNLFLHEYNQFEGISLKASYYQIVASLVPKFERGTELDMVFSVLSIVSAIILLLAAYYLKDKYDILLAFSMILILVPRYSNDYCIVYFIPPLICFLNSKELKRGYLICLFAFILMSEAFFVEGLNGKQWCVVLLYLYIMFKAIAVVTKNVNFLNKPIVFKSFFKTMMFFVVIIATLLLKKVNVLAADYFRGEGTRNDPFLISTKEDLLYFADKVNQEGVSYEGKWFKQTDNIDLSGVDWIPIGVFGSDNYFFGIYDGDGHTISNITMNRVDNGGFFGVLGGKCINLGIESGVFKGACVGAISSHSASSNAMIYNCYNKADVFGSRAGGIVDNFDGKVYNCWSDCCLVGDVIGAIYAFSVTDIESCYTTLEISSLNEPDIIHIDKLDESICMALNLYRYKSCNELFYASDVNPWIVENGELIYASKTNDDFSEFLKKNISFFSGEGTKVNPYKIANEMDFRLLADMVNYGHEGFGGIYFQQSCDIDFKSKLMDPIGISGSGNYFWGVYDGNGYALKRVYIERKEDTGIFGALGGVCMNLGIYSGLIKGQCVGAFSSHAASTTALIYNCYNYAIVEGSRAGGIVDDFSGMVINCYSRCALKGKETGSIASTNVRYSYNCHGTRQLFGHGNYGGEYCSVVDSTSPVKCEKLFNNLVGKSTYIKDLKQFLPRSNRWGIDNSGRLVLCEIKNENNKDDIFNNCSVISCGVFCIIIVLGICECVIVRGKEN